MKTGGGTLLLGNLLNWGALDTFTEDPRARAGRWLVERGRYGASSGTLVSTSADQEVPELSLDPGVSGWHDVRVRMYHPARPERYGVRVGAGSDRGLRMLRPELASEAFETLSLGPRNLTGASIRVDGSYANCYLDAVELVPCDPPRARPPAEKELCGICDFPVAVDDYRPIKHGAAECVRVHAEAGFTTVFWRAFGVCCEFPSKIGQTRTPEWDGDARMCIGRHLEKYDVLGAAAEEARACGLKVLGWMRISNEFSAPTGHFSATTPFHLAHPEMRQLNADGSPRPRLSFAYPEVRQYLCSIGREILERGVDGLMIDVLRHPPMAIFDQPLVDGFIRETGEDPRKMPGDGSEAWLRYRATAFTSLLRDFRAAMDSSGFPDKPIYVRAMPEPWRLLRDGCDVDAWLSEGLVDTFIAESHWHPSHLDLAPVQQIIKGRARLVATVMSCSGIEAALAAARKAYRQGADGTAVYESDVTVTFPTCRDRLHALRYATAGSS